MSVRLLSRFVVPSLAVLLVLPSSASAAADATWTQTAPRLQRGPQSLAPAPAQSAAFTLRRAGLEPRLRAAPRERSRGGNGPTATVTIPMPDGSLQRFAVVESPVMAPALAARVRGFRSYAAVGIDDPTATARLDLSSLGFHATGRSASGSWFVDPVDPLDPERHLAYRGTAREGVGLREPITSGARPRRATSGRPAPGAPVDRRVYRLALASDPTYADEFPGAVDEAKATLVNRANQLYNDDLAIELVLVAGNDRLNYDTAAEFVLAGYPATAECLDPTLTANQVATDRAIGEAAYDVGHLISASSSGGFAGLGVVGRDGRKAEGCSGIPDPRGDSFAIDYFAHELGHQFDAEHTFNGTRGGCADNREETTAVEPGSGSSVMAYAGICGADNLQPHTDPYFSQRSLTQIQAYVASNQGPGARNGGTVSATGNRAPVVSAPAGQTIPARTPFTLTGSATDPDGDPTILLWEQNDTAPGAGTPLFSNTKPAGALFRQFGTIAPVTPAAAKLSPSPGQNQATADGSRTFPDLAQVASGNTNAASGACPEASAPPSVAQVECFSEFLPTSARTMRFRLTARDRVLTGGGESSADTAVEVTDAGPFRVTSQAGPEAVTGLAAVPVTWDVAGTVAAPVSTTDVRILYSTDGGQSFPTVLAARTANDGARTVTIPDVTTAQGRVRVEAVGNIFFDLSDADLAVTSTGGAPPPDPDPDGAPQPAPAPSPGPGRQAPIVRSPALTGEAAKFPAKIRVLRAGVAKRRLDVLAEITRRASGRVRVAYRSGGRTTRFTARIRDGRIRFERRLTGANGRLPTGIFTLSYAGDADVRADEVRLRAADGRAGLRRGTTRISGGVLEVEGTISRRARGVVRIRLEYLDGVDLERRSYRARIRNGRWRLEQPLPDAAAVAGGQLSIQFTGYEPVPLRGEQGAKRVAPG